MIVHLIILDKFIPPLIDLIQEDVAEFDHKFIIWGKADYSYGLKENSNIKFFDTKKKIVDLIQDLNFSDKIIIHGLWSKILIVSLFFQPWLLRKCFWIIWGGDLYSYREKKVKGSDKIIEFFRSKIIRKFGFLLTHVPGDIDLARKWYQAEGAWIDCLGYLSNTFSEKLSTRSHNNGLTLLIGNSADPSNNHAEVFERLKNSEILSRVDKIVVPLTYGEHAYKDRIVRLGYNLFQSRFDPLIDFLSYDSYKKILNQIDIAIFNHDRQQAMGNTIQLLGMGKKVYIKHTVPQWDYLQSLGLTVFSNEELISPDINNEFAKKNHEIVVSHFSRERLVTQLNEIFSKRVL